MSEDGHHIGITNAMNGLIFSIQMTLRLLLKITTRVAQEFMRSSPIKRWKEILMNILLVDDDRFIIEALREKSVGID